MTRGFAVSLVGPSRIGKTTLLTAMLSETRELLAGSGVEVAMDERTQGRVHRKQRDLRRAIEVGEFDAAALGGDQKMTDYHVALQVVGDDGIRIPFDLLDYPGSWMLPEIRARVPEATTGWPRYLEHVRSSIMLLVPIDAAVLMEATAPRQKAAVIDLLELVGVEDVGRTWAMGRQQADEEPAVLVLAPLKCEKYFGDNGGRGGEEGELRRRVLERYEGLRKIVESETAGRSTPVRTVYAPIDTYGCVELRDARWPRREGLDHLDFEASYLFRGHPPRIRPRAAGTVMQELCRSVLGGQALLDEAQRRRHESSHQEGLSRQGESKGFWGTLDYYLSGEASQVKQGIRDDEDAITRLRARQLRLTGAARALVAAGHDPRVEVWGATSDV